MNTVQVALYARVSSEQQSEAKTIDSQLADLRGQIAARSLTLACEQEFIDDGESWGHADSSSVRALARRGSRWWH